MRGHCPLAPPLLCAYWVQNAYNEVCSRRPWTWLRAENEILVNDAKTGTVNVTRGSAIVNGGTMAYATSDADRQIRLASNNSPVYTIITATASSYTLDRPFGDTSATAASATVLDAYISMPADFARFLAVLDTHNNWQLHFWVTDEELNSWDAQRSASGTPWTLASRRLATAGTFTGRIQFELWPYTSTAKNYPYFYIRKAETLVDSSTFLGPLSTNGNLLVQLALAEAAKWPGLEDRKNPYFGLPLAQGIKAETERELARMEVQDEEIYMTWWETVSWINRYPFAPIDSRYLQSHDVDMVAPMGATWPH